MPTEPTTTEPSETWTRRGVGLTGVELITITPSSGRDRDYLFSLIDGAMNSEAQLDQLAVDAALLITRMEWYNQAASLLIELSRHVISGRDGVPFMVLPNDSQRDLLDELVRLADLACPPFDPSRPVYEIDAGNNMDVEADVASGFPTMCMDAGAEMVRPGCADGYYNYGRGAWSLRLQLPEGTTLDAWMRALAHLWRERIGEESMGIEISLGDERVLREHLQALLA